MSQPRLRLVRPDELEPVPIPVPPPMRTVEQAPDNDLDLSAVRVRLAKLFVVLAGLLALILGKD